MKQKYIIIFFIASAFFFVSFIHKCISCLPKEATINVWLQTDSNSRILISGLNTDNLHMQLSKRIRIPLAFNEKTMIEEGLYYIDVYSGEKKIHSFIVHDENNIYDAQSETLYRCHCLEELRRILITYISDKYLRNIELEKE